MKRLLTILLVSILAVVAVFGFVGCDNENTDKKGSVGMQIKRYSGDTFNTLYKYVEEEGVTTLTINNVGRIKAGAFDGNSSLKEIVVGSSVTEIDAGAFKGMKSLEKITLTFVGANANSDAYYGQTASAVNKAVDAKRTFGYVFGTEEYEGGAKIVNNYGSGDATYYIPATLSNVVLNIKSDACVPMYAFKGVTQITKVTVNGAKEVGEYAFNGCTSLREVVLGNTVKTLYKYAFEGCTNLATCNTSGLTSIGEKAFENTQIKLSK